MSFSFQIANIANTHDWPPSWIIILKNNLIKICVGSYVTLNGLVRIALFKFIYIFPKTVNMDP
jgi:hypothetical protein